MRELEIGAGIETMKRHAHRALGGVLALVIVGVAVFLLLAIIAFALIFVSASRRHSRQEEAVQTLWTVLRAESSLRSNDQDGSRIPDYWIGDVAGLCILIPAGMDPLEPSQRKNKRPMRLIEEETAAADGDFGGNGVRYPRSWHADIGE